MDYAFDAVVSYRDAQWTGTLPDITGTPQFTADSLPELREAITTHLVNADPELADDTDAVRASITFTLERVGYPLNVAVRRARMTHLIYQGTQRMLTATLAEVMPQLVDLSMPCVDIAELLGMDVSTVRGCLVPAGEHSPTVGQDASRDAAAPFAP